MGQHELTRSECTGPIHLSVWLHVGGTDPANNTVSNAGVPGSNATAAA